VKQKIVFSFLFFSKKVHARLHAKASKARGAALLNGDGEEEKGWESASRQARKAKHKQQEAGIMGGHATVGHSTLFVTTAHDERPGLGRLVDRCRCSCSFPSTPPSPWRKKALAQR